MKKWTRLSLRLCRFMKRLNDYSVVQRTEIEWGGSIARERFALNLSKVVTLNSKNLVKGSARWRFP